MWRFAWSATFTRFSICPGVLMTWERNRLMGSRMIFTPAFCAYSASVCRPSAVRGALQDLARAAVEGTGIGHAAQLGGLVHNGLVKLKRNAAIGGVVVRHIRPVGPGAAGTDEQHDAVRLGGAARERGGKLHVEPDRPLDGLEAEAIELSVGLFERARGLGLEA